MALEKTFAAFRGVFACEDVFPHAVGQVERRVLVLYDDELGVPRPRNEVVVEVDLQIRGSQGLFVRRKRAVPRLQGVAAAVDILFENEGVCVSRSSNFRSSPAIGPNRALAPELWCWLASLW